jgi:hypothetical protein
MAAEHWEERAFDHHHATLLLQAELVIEASKSGYTTIVAFKWRQPFMQGQHNTFTFQLYKHHIK